MKNITVDTLLRKMKDECIFKNSEFMDKVILMDKSIYQYYKKYYNKNIFFHPIKLLKYLKIKRALKNQINQSYINTYLFSNQGWIRSDFIPKDRKDRLLEIVNYFGKPLKIRLFDYGFIDINDKTGVMYGWVCWVQRWRFLDNKSNDIELTEYKKRGSKKK